MRIATWNIKGVRGRLGYLLNWLQERKPDLVALQKIIAQDKDFPFEAFAEAGYHAEVHGCPPRPHANYGVAILSRRQSSIVRKGLPGQDGLGPRLLTVDLDGLEFSSVYAPSKLEDAGGNKVAWFESLARHLATTCPESGRRVLCGDFNVVPECRYGPRGPKSTPAYDKRVQERFGNMLDAAGIVDLYDAPQSDPGWIDRFTFKDHEGLLHFSRLEYVLGTQSMVDLNPVVRFDVDHAIDDGSFNSWMRTPIVADFDE